jgi:hypothetical protein
LWAKVSQWPPSNVGEQNYAVAHPFNFLTLQGTCQNVGKGFGNSSPKVCMAKSVVRTQAVVAGAGAYQPSRDWVQILLRTELPGHAQADSLLINEPEA